MSKSLSISKVSMKCVNTRNDLHKELNQFGFSAESECFIPVFTLSLESISEGKRHVNIVPAKLLSHEYNLWGKNEYRLFAVSFTDGMRDISNHSGQDIVLFMLNYSKVRHLLDLAATDLRTPLLMHIHCKVLLMDHYFIVSPQHKVILYACKICDVTKVGVL